MKCSYGFILLTLWLTLIQAVNAVHLSSELAGGKIAGTALAFEWLSPTEIVILTDTGWLRLHEFSSGHLVKSIRLPGKLDKEFYFAVHGGGFSQNGRLLYEYGLDSNNRIRIWNLVGNGKNLSLNLATSDYSSEEEYQRLKNVITDNTDDKSELYFDHEKQKNEAEVARALVDSRWVIEMLRKLRVDAATNKRLGRGESNIELLVKLMYIAMGSRDKCSAEAYLYFLEKIKEEATSQAKESKKMEDLKLLSKAVFDPDLAADTLKKLKEKPQVTEHKLPSSQEEWVNRLRKKRREALRLNFEIAKNFEEFLYFWNKAISDKNTAPVFSKGEEGLREAGRYLHIILTKIAPTPENKHHRILYQLLEVVWKHHKEGTFFADDQQIFKEAMNNLRLVVSIYDVNAYLHIANDQDESKRDVIGSTWFSKRKGVTETAYPGLSLAIQAELIEAVIGTVRNHMDRALVENERLYKNLITDPTTGSRDENKIATASQKHKAICAELIAQRRSSKPPISTTDKK